jgi:signal transduction histidine kinase/ActR/RegA family two-component response regulator
MGQLKRINKIVPAILLVVFFSTIALTMTGFLMLRAVYAPGSIITAESENAAKNFTLLFFSITISAFIIITVLILILIRISLIRLGSISTFSTKAAAGFLEERIDVKGSEEFRKVVNNLNTMMENMENISRAKGDFLSRMSHEIRTPMNAIIGMTAIAKNADSEEKIMDCLKKIENNSNHLLGIINDILDYSKIESGKLVLNEELFSLSQNMDFIDSMFKSRTEEKNIDFSITLKNIQHDGIIGDSLRLNQVIINLLSNAVKFTDKGGRIRLATEELVYVDGLGVYRFTVRDTGIGIDPEQAKNLFTPFTQANSKISGHYGGTGLGLAISKNIVETMGGEIELNSVPGEGSVFAFTIRTRAETIIPKKKNTSQRQDRPDFSGKRFLIVDDIDINREICLEILAETGADLETAENGKKALDAFCNSPEFYYDMILMDMQMPVMDGCAATEKIRSSGRHDSRTVKIVAMTANVMQDDVQKIFASGMNEHIAKPIDINKAFRTMQEIMRESNAETGV